MAKAAFYRSSFCMILFFCCGGIAKSQVLQIAWNLNDVSYLYPLPAESELESFSWLSPKSTGKKNQLLPLESFQRLPSLNSGGSGQMTMYDHQLKVVGVRIDPCPGTHITGVSCDPEIRHVWQPILNDQFANRIMTTDLAIHTFYKLSSMELKALAGNLKTLKSDLAKLAVNTDRKPLNIHPGFANAKTRDLIMKRLNEIVLDS